MTYATIPPKGLDTTRCNYGRSTNFFTKKKNFTYVVSKLLVNEIVMLVVSLDEN